MHYEAIIIIIVYIRVKKENKNNLNEAESSYDRITFYLKKANLAMDILRKSQTPG